MNVPSTPSELDLDAYPAQSVSYQSWILFLATGMVAAALLLQRASGNQETKLQLVGMTAPLPELCMSKRLFGARCPGCGLTRSVVASSRGQLRRAMDHHPAGPIIFLWALVQIPYRIGNLWRLRKRGGAWQLPGAGVTASIITAICIVQWVVRSSFF